MDEIEPRKILNCDVKSERSRIRKEKKLELLNRQCAKMLSDNGKFKSTVIQRIMDREFVKINACTIEVIIKVCLEYGENYYKCIPCHALKDYINTECLFGDWYVENIHRPLFANYFIIGWGVAFNIRLVKK